jgi:hypothetical protein
MSPQAGGSLPIGAPREQTLCQPVHSELDQGVQTFMLMNHQAIMSPPYDGLSPLKLNMLIEWV